jgi:hypothetical protein
MACCYRLWKDFQSPLSETYYRASPTDEYNDSICNRIRSDFEWPSSPVEVYSGAEDHILCLHGTDRAQGDRFSTLSAGGDDLTNRR